MYVCMYVVYTIDTYMYTYVVYTIDTYMYIHSMYVFVHDKHLYVSIKIHNSSIYLQH